jgi:PKD repeat protein
MTINRLALGIVTVVAACGSLLLIPSRAAAVQTLQMGVVSAVPASYTPDVTDGVVYTIGESGGTVVLGGSFTSVSAHASNATVPDEYLTAFTAGTGTLVSGFAPTVNGSVYAVTAGPTPGTMYVGGAFTTIDGVSARVALISTATGAIVPGWTSPAINGDVNTLVSSGGQLFVGGYFTTVAKTSHVGLAVLDGTSGALVNYATPTFTGHHNYGVNCNPSTSSCAKAGTGIKSMDINPAGTLLVAVGNFNTVSGASRDQIALLNLSTSGATLDTAWATAAYTASCYANYYDTYLRDVQFSPDGSYFVSVATGGGGHGVGGTPPAVNSDGTHNDCDAAARWESSGTGSDVSPTWIDRTGNDTFLSVSVTGAAVYVGGHERWVNNSMGEDAAREGAVPRPGIAALDPINGMPLAWNPGRNPRGEGAYALFATPDGLYVGSDTDYIGDRKYLHRKIAFFPSAGGYSLASNQAGALPGSVYLLGSGTSTSTARVVRWDGTSAPGTPTTTSAVDWSTARGAFEINNEVYYGDTDGNFYQRSFDGTTFGPAVAIDPYDDPTWDNVQTGSGQTYRGLQSNFYGEMSSLTSMFYSAGRVYYTLSGNPHMFWRWFEPDSGTMGADEFTTTDSIDWSHVAGAFLSGSTLYYADSVTKSLFEVPFTGGEASGVPAIADASMDWTSLGAFVAPAPPPNQPPVAAFSANCSGLTCSFDASASRDPDGSVVSYAWSWGDGTSETDTTPTATHTYSGPGTDTVTLVVTDNDGATDSTTQTVQPSVFNGPTVVFEGAATYDGNTSSARVTIPAATAPGDQLLMFVTYASTSLTNSAPAGWSAVGSTSHSNLTTVVYQHTAQSGDAGSPVSVTFSGTVKASLTVADYTNAALESESSSTDSSTSSHVAPALSGLSEGSFVVTFWGDKSTGTTSWAAPADVTVETTAFGSGGGAVSALLGDSGAAVSGAYPQHTATTNVTSGSGAAWTIALASS